MLRQCPHHGFSELHQIDNFYNGLNEHEQDSLNVVAGRNLLRKTPRDALTIIENKSKVCYSRNKLVAFKTFNKKMTTPATVKAIEETCVICGGAHPHYDCIATNSNILSACATTAITFKVGQTSKYSYNDAESINQIEVIDVACEEYVQEVLGFSDNSKSGNPIPNFDPIISFSSPSLTPFKGGDFILEEIDACLTIKSIPPGIDDTDFDLEGDIRLLEELLNKDPSSSPIPLKELNVEEIKIVKSSIDEPPKLELKELPSHLEYAFLEGTDKLPVIISKEIKDKENPPF
nr:reverse transcriptase domain-containing protein [Tanacetum cinerariifolium]